MEVKFKPLYGLHASGPLSFLLQINQFTILLDCGWGDPYHISTLEPLLDILDNVDAVLLSHPDPAHLGALPMLVGKAKMDAAIYATSAIHKMGQMFLYSEYLTRHAASDFTAFDLDDVDAAFNRVTQLRYRQEVALSGLGAGISITPLPSGRLIGGTVWKITAGGEEFVYAVDFNHRRERHLNGTSLESVFHRPSLLISDASTVNRPPVDRERSERILLDACLSTLRSEGNVLIPIDAAGRLLEILLVIESYWNEQKFPYPVALVGPMVHTTLEFARSQLEWMNEALVKSFGHSKDNPFALRHIKLYSNTNELRKLPPGPRVVLAVEDSLGSGPSRQLLVEWARDPRNAVMLPLEPSQGSLAEEIVSLAAQRDSFPNSPPPVLVIPMLKRVPLQGEELEKYLEEQARLREEAAAAAEAAAANGMLLDDYLQSSAGDVAGGSPRSVASAKSTGHGPTRANVASIGHAARDAAGLGSSAGVGGGSSAGGSMMETDDLIKEQPFVEAEGTVACLIEGFELQDGAVVPMFPAEDDWEFVQYDEYGAVFDHRELEGGDAGGAIPGGALGAALASEAEAERGTEGEDAVAAEEAPEAQLPTKIERNDVSVPFAARVLRVDFDGRSDGRSVRTMIGHIAPRVSIIIHGSDEHRATLANKLSTELEGLHATVLTPNAGQEVEVPTTASFEIDLSDTLMKAVEMHAVGKYELAWVNGVVGAPENGEERGEIADAEQHVEGVDGGVLPEKMPVLLPKTAAGAASAAGALDGGAEYGGVFIGDVRLSELKKALAAAGIRAEFHAGALYCAEQVVVRRRGEGGGLVLEGAMSDAYYKVRDIVYGQYHVC